jgi:septum formation protein
VIPLILASASPRRAELLRQAGIDFVVMPADVDETVAADEVPEDYVRRVSEAKARAVAARAPGSRVLGADTTVVVSGEIFGKPCDADDARRMLRALSDRTHEVLTAVTLAGPALSGVEGPAPGAVEGPGIPPVLETRVAVTSVEFAPMSDAEIDWYVSTGEPMDKAGAYAIQGLASRFVTRITGSYSNVVGLPVALVYGLLRGRRAGPYPAAGSSHR